MTTCIPEKVYKIMQTLIDDNHEVYIIGGAVRDLMMCDEPHDYDLFTDATGEEILSLFPYGKIIGSETRRNKILTVIVDGIEVSQYRANGNRTETGISLEDHLNTCDLTINSMVMDINGKITDPHHGRTDIHDRIVRSVGDPRNRIEEDKIRAFRAIRFAAKYDFHIDKHLCDAIWDTDLSDVPIERIREEILKIIMYPHGLEMMDQFGLLEKVIPEFSLCCGMNGGHHHDETVDYHMFNAQNTACGITDNPILVFTCAFHDIGKGSSYQPKPDDDISFHHHEKVGAEIIHDVMERMKFSTNDIKYVETLISEHMFGWHPKGTTKMFVRHFGRFERAGITIEEYVTLQYCDHQGNQKNRQIKFGDWMCNNELIHKYYELKHSSTPFGIKDLDVDGHDLMAFGVPAGPDVGAKLDELLERVLNGEIPNEYYILINSI